MKRLIIWTIIVILVLGASIVWGVIFRPEFDNSEETRAALQTTQYHAIDARSRSELPDIDYVDDTTELEVAEMPEFYLGLPKESWFEQDVLQQMGAELGLTSAASVENLGSQYMWQEGNKTFIANPSVGLFKFTMDLSKESETTEIPTQEDLRASIDSLFESVVFPTVYFDLDNISYQDLVLDENNNLVDFTLGAGSYLKATIPYVVSTVRMILPLESSVIINGSGEVVSLVLFVPNIGQSDDIHELMGINRAKSQLRDGIGVVVEQNGLVEDYNISDIYPAYYLNMQTFYSNDRRRILSPVYIFENATTRVALLAK